MKLTFVQAARGVNKEIQVNVVDTCNKCSGSRTEPGTKAIRCHYCNGSGYETISTGNKYCFLYFTKHIILRQILFIIFLW